MNKKKMRSLAIGISALCLMVALLTFTIDPLPSRAQTRSGQEVTPQPAKQGTVSRQGPIRGPLYKFPPAQRPERETEKEHPPINTPIDPSVRPEDIRPTSPETVTKVISELPEKIRRSPEPEAAGTFALFRNATTGDRPAVPGAAPPTGFAPYEPSVGVNGRVVFYTTNNYAAVSGDRGQNYSYINPWDNFPADNTVDPLNGNFGGDQYVYYERTRGLMCWLIQYNPDNTNNTYRLAIARSQADLLNNTWYFYDFTPATFGLATPTGAQGVWLDFPDLSASDNFLYFTANYFPRRTTTTGGCVITCPGTCPAGCTSGCTGCGSLGAVIARLPLNQLAQAQALSFNFYNDTNFAFRLTHGAHGTMYWGSHNKNTQIRIYRWDETSNNIPPHDDVTHAAYNAPGAATYTATCSDGINFASAADDRILGAWVANGVIGFMWDAGQGGSFASPHVEVLRFNESDRTLVTQGQIYNPNFAYLYPSVHPNDRGDLGGTIAYGCGGGSGSPGIAAWIADDFNSGTITPLENVSVAVGNRAEGRWGDFFTTRVNSPYGNTWIGTGFVLNTPADPTKPAGTGPRDQRFVWFGRERDTPPATNFIFVNLDNTTGYEDGSFGHPYQTVTRGTFAAMPGDTIFIRSGNYNEALRMTTPTTVQATGGTVTVGKKP